MGFPTLVVEFNPTCAEQKGPPHSRNRYRSRTVARTTVPFAQIAAFLSLCAPVVEGDRPSPVDDRSAHRGANFDLRYGRMMPPQVDVIFVKASDRSITLEFDLAADKEHKANAISVSTASIVKYELQWMEYNPVLNGASSSPDQGWEVASSALRSSRCTKSNLTPGVSYIFRARACNGSNVWGEFGTPTNPIRTLLSDIPEKCSEALKISSKVKCCSTHCCTVHVHTASDAPRSVCAVMHCSSIILMDCSAHALLLHCSCVVAHALL